MISPSLSIDLDAFFSDPEMKLDSAAQINILDFLDQVVSDFDVTLVAPDHDPEDVLLWLYRVYQWHFSRAAYSFLQEPELIAFGMVSNFFRVSEKKPVNSRYHFTRAMTTGVTSDDLVKTLETIRPYA